MASLQLQNSDVITFHSYEPPDQMKRHIASLRRYGRPIVCTEYMARPRASTFFAILRLLKDEKVGAYNWGFVNGKSQTIYPYPGIRGRRVIPRNRQSGFMTSFGRTAILTTPQRSL